MKLGEAMIKEGLITSDTLARSLERQIIFGGMLGTNLVEMGAISEENLARFLGKVLGVPYAGPSHFEEVAQDALDAVKAELAEKYIIFPLKKERSRLHLAMKNPNDIALADELRFVFGVEIKGYIASEIRILYALEKHYGIKRDLRYVNILEEEEIWDKKSDTAHDIIDLPVHNTEVRRPAEPPVSREAAKMPVPEAVPAKEPVTEARPVIPAEVPIEPAAEFAKGPDVLPAIPAPSAAPATPYEMLSMPTDRETIAQAVVMAAGEKFSRVALFRIKDGVLSGWKSAVSGGAADISELIIKLSLPCIFKEVVEEKSFYRGPVMPLPQNDTLMDALGGDRPSEAMACPLIIKDKVVGVLYGDNGPGSMTRCDASFFTSLMAKASMSLEILILKHKILS